MIVLSQIDLPGSAGSGAALQGGLRRFRVLGSVALRESAEELGRFGC
jgi:hypothetical protein